MVAYSDAIIQWHLGEGKLLDMQQGDGSSDHADYKSV